jgi:hypothetical protein
LAEQSQSKSTQSDAFVPSNVRRSSSKARLAWLKQELEIRQQQENKIRHDLSNALLDSEADRKYFASELVKREALIDDLAREKNSKNRANEACLVTCDSR